MLEPNSAGALSPRAVSGPPPPSRPRALSFEEGSWISDPAARDDTIDALRGIAIAAMVWGHLGVFIFDPAGHGAMGPELASIPPLWTAVVGGIAPALFIAVSGMMVAYVYGRYGRGLRRQLLRMAVLLGLGATIDVLFWRIRPFTTVDVLYCIALVLPLCHLFAAYVPRRLMWPGAVAVLAVTPLLQRWLGYADYPLEVALSGRLVHAFPNQTSILHHWLVDGWFPLFPWLGFGWLGVALAQGRLAASRPPRGRPALVGVGVGCLAASLALGWPNLESQKLMRLEVGGAFMPPDAGYMLACVGGVLLLTSALDCWSAPRVRWPFAVLGQAPLFIYVGHFPVIHLVARLVGARVPIALSVLTIAATLACLVAAAWGWIRVRGRVWRRLRQGVAAAGWP